MVAIVLQGNEKTYHFWSASPHHVPGMLINTESGSSYLYVLYCLIGGLAFCTWWTLQV